MVDIFALSIAHGLLVLAAIRLVLRDDLDQDGAPRQGRGLRGKRLGERARGGAGNGPETGRATGPEHPAENGLGGPP